MNTKTAWLKMIFQKGIQHKLNITDNTLYWYRSQAKDLNKFPTNGAMEEHLHKSGWKIAIEREWEQPKEIKIKKSPV